MVDYHIHTCFSDGEADFRTVIDLAEKQGLEQIAITDHFDPNDVHLLNRFTTENELALHFEAIRKYSERKRLRVWCGIETCTGFDGCLVLSDRVKSMCDMIITSPHYVEYGKPLKAGDYFCRDYWEAYRQKVLNMALGGGDVLGHPEGYLPIGPMGVEGTTYESRQCLCKEICDRFFTEDYIEELGRRLVRSGKACELHGATSTPREWVVARLARRGVSFSVGSDAHAVSLLGKSEYAGYLIKKYSLKILSLPR